MSGGTACKNPAHRPSWHVTQRKCNHSAFNGGRMTPSEYSEVRCGTCGHRWRTKAAYVDLLPDAVPTRLEGITMHTTKLTGGVVAHHDGSYEGGPVLLEVPATEAKLETGKNPDGSNYVMVTVPFDALKQLVANYVRGEAIDFYEQASADEVLRSAFMRRDHH